MNLAYHLLKLLAPKAKKFERDTTDPVRTQERVLLDLLGRNKETVYGRRYNFAAIRSVEDYQLRVPLVDYEEIRAYVDRMVSGEAHILTAEKPVFFGRTSGTTGEPKLIPVTVSSRAKKAELMALWIYYLIKDHPGVTSGKIFAIIDPEAKTVTPSGIPCGPENGHAYVNLPSIVKRLCAVPYEAFEITDYDARYYTILRLAIAEDISTIATLNPSALVILCQKIALWKDQIIEDIAAGTLRRDLAIPQPIRAVIGRHLRPNPRRAAMLRALLRDKGELLPKDFWPNLAAIECWKGGTVKLYIQDLPRYFGALPVRDFGCFSTESRNSIPITDEGAGGILAIETNFYEFIPVADLHARQRRTLTCSELEIGKEYVLVVTTAGGLYRYDTDDIVRVTGFFNKTPVIEFIQKARNAISITGEKVYESHITEAVNRSATKLGLEIAFFSGAIEMTAPPRYIILAEFIGTPPTDAKRRLIQLIEADLRTHNLEYEDTRARYELGIPVLKVVKPGEFERYRRKKVGEGAHETQFKVPGLSRDVHYQEQFAILEEIPAE